MEVSVANKPMELYFNHEDIAVFRCTVVSGAKLQLLLALQHFRALEHSCNYNCMKHQHNKDL